MKSIHRLGRVLCGAVVLLALVSSPALADEEGDRPQPAADLVVEEAFQVESSEALQDQVNAANNPLADLIAVSCANSATAMASSSILRTPGCGHVRPRAGITHTTDTKDGS